MKTIEINIFYETLIGLISVQRFKEAVPWLATLLDKKPISRPENAGCPTAP